MHNPLYQFSRQLIHYICSRCELNIPGHTPQTVPEGSGQHSHNGEFLRCLDSRPITGAGIIAAYRLWLNTEDRVNRQRSLARALQHPGRIVPVTPQERAISMIVGYTADSWIRHGAEVPEHTDYTPSTAWPTAHSRARVGTAVLQHQDHTWYAVDLDRPPFRGFDQHPVEQFSGQPWSYTVGLLPVSRFRRQGGVLYHPPDRDHYYARSAAPADQWLFLYRDFDENTQEPEAQQAARQRLHRSDVPQLHWQEYTEFAHLWHHLQTLNTVLNLVSPEA